MNKQLAAQHGIVCRLPGEHLGYFGWPSIARLDDGRLIVASSGLRSEHVCPFGKTVLNTSADQGITWSKPHVIQNSPIDDRDAGIVNLGSGRLLVTWFTADTREYLSAAWVRERVGNQELEVWQAATALWTDDLVQQWLGSWVRLSEDGGASWEAPLRVPVSAPHGPLCLASGDLLYLGKDATGMSEGRILAAGSRDGGRSWSVLGQVPLYPGTTAANYHEPHAVEITDGRLLGLIRLENHTSANLEAAGLVDFSLMQTESVDRGQTWSMPVPLGFHGSPPHLLKHSSGVLVCAYGYRRPGFGQRVMISRDQGVTWEHDWIIRDDGPDGDLGYPASVELEDGSILSVYYQKVPGDAKCSLLWSRWHLP
jgi:sialidase-1